jgi:hypothetical protein
VDGEAGGVRVSRLFGCCSVSMLVRSAFSPPLTLRKFVRHREGNLGKFAGGGMITAVLRREGG